MTFGEKIEASPLGPGERERYGYQSAAVYSYFFSCYVILNNLVSRFT